MAVFQWVILLWIFIEMDVAAAVRTKMYCSDLNMMKLFIIRCLGEYVDPSCFLFSLVFVHGQIGVSGYCGEMNRTTGLCSLLGASFEWRKTCLFMISKNKMFLIILRMFHNSVVNLSSGAYYDFSRHSPLVWQFHSFDICLKWTLWTDPRSIDQTMSPRPCSAVIVIVNITVIHSVETPVW